MKILKRYYILCNVLYEATEVLKTTTHLLIQNTCFKPFFDLELFTRYVFFKLIQEDFIISHCVEIAETYAKKMCDENDEDK